MKSCRENDADKLWDALADGEATIGALASCIGRGTRYVHSLVRQWPERFILVRFGGPVRSGVVGRCLDGRQLQIDE